MGIIVIAHYRPDEGQKDAAIQDIWRRMGEIGFFPAANELKEYSAPFAHFIPKDY